jgi:ribosomal protein S18 acetylase RimI-like enzyme
MRNNRPVTIPDDLTVDSELDRVDWARAKAKLALDAFDNGRSAEALRLSFERSQHVVFAWLNGDLVGMARLLSDQVCNAYLIDVWTDSAVRRRGVATAMVDYLAARVPGQHIGLQTGDAQGFYARLGFKAQPEFMSRVVGRWLDNEANRFSDPGRL